MIDPFTSDNFYKTSYSLIKKIKNKTFVYKYRPNYQTQVVNQGKIKKIFNKFEVIRIKVYSIVLGYSNENEKKQKDEEKKTIVIFIGNFRTMS